MEAMRRCWSNFIACSLLAYLPYALQYQCVNACVPADTFSPKSRLANVHVSR